MTKVHSKSTPHESDLRCLSGDGGGVDAAMVLTVWRKSLVLNGKGFAVFDAKGNLVFRVDNYASRNKGKVVLMDGFGKPLLTIRKKKLSLGDQWSIYDGEDVAAAPLFSVKKHTSFIYTKNSLHVTPVSCAASGGRYEVEGSYSQRCCAVYDETQRRLAAVEPKAAVGVDVFRLVVEPGFDSAVAMAVVILLDQAFGSRGSLLKSF
ncbi:protein LURP-one-related 8-like [Typha latifolia]|uniref:protein LURP-one-related 8-like n=1 Tax=Typha latifolia TaxID=4733 RepID=UPI003C2F794A